MGRRDFLDAGICVSGIVGVGQEHVLRGGAVAVGDGDVDGGDAVVMMILTSLHRVEQCTTRHSQLDVTFLDIGIWKSSRLRDKVTWCPPGIGIYPTSCLIAPTP